MITMRTDALGSGVMYEVLDGEIVIWGAYVRFTRRSHPRMVAAAREQERVAMERAKGPNTN